MYVYRIRGADYDSIATYSNSVGDKVYSSQYYMKNGRIVSSVGVEFVCSIEKGKVSLNKINTDATDTVILPKYFIQSVEPYAMSGVKFKRLVIPFDTKLELKDKALYGSASLEEFISLSSEVTYGSSVFPSTIVRRRL